MAGRKLEAGRGNNTTPERVVDMQKQTAGAKAVKEKVAYLKGLVNGSDSLLKEPKERAVWESMVDVLDGIADAIGQMDAERAELEEYVESIDEDLTNIEDEIYSDEDEDEEGSEGPEYVEMECPGCKESVYFEEDLLYQDDVEVTCPNCGAVIYSNDGDKEAAESGGQEEQKDHDPEE